MSYAGHTATSEQGSSASRAAAGPVQAKLSVGRSHDTHEQEADRVAGVVVGDGAASFGAAPAARSAVGSRVAPKISRLAESGVKKEQPEAKLQRQEEEETQAKIQRQEEKEEPAQAKVQRKAEEEEPQTKIQRQAEEEPQAKVQRQEEKEEPAQAKVQRQAEEEEPQTKVQRQAEEEEPQTKVQRKAEEEEPQTKVQRQEEEEPQAKIQKQDEEKEPVQAKAEARPTVRDKRQFPVLERVEPKLFANKGRGEPLDEKTRTSMETGFRADFRSVRVHTGGDAVEMNRELRAQAFTHGKDVFFNAGKYEPESARGKTLLAHELTHVVQQGAAEQNVSEETVAKNNAERNVPPPEPADKEARGVEAKTSDRVEKGEPKPGETPPAEAKPAKGEEAKEKAAEKKKAATGAGKRAAPEDKPAEGKAEAKRGGVGDFLRKVTKTVFQAKKAGISRLGRNEKKKEPAEAKLAQSEKAVVPPSEEGGSRAKASQVETVEKAKEPKPDEGKAKEEFDQKLQSAIPTTIEEVDEFKEKGKGRIVGQAVKSVVTADAQEVKGTYQEIDNPPEAAPPEAEPEDLPETEAAPETSPIGMGEGVVGEVQPEHTDLTEFDKQSDEMLETEGIQEEHLEMVDEGDLAEAKKERKSLKSKVQEGPREVKALEQEEKQKVSKDLQKEEHEGKRKMRGERQKKLQGTREDQKKTKSKLEEKRQQVTDHINGIYEKANTTVKQKLEELEKKSLKDFENGEKAATQSFEDNVKRRMDAFKQRRYDRFGGSLLWAKDKLFGMDDLPEVKGIFDTEKSHFVTAIDSLVKTITAENKRVIQECKEIVTKARAEIEKYVKGLGPELRKTGQDALKDMKGKLDALDKGISDKEKELQKKLAEKREAAIKAIEEKIEKMKEEMSGLISKLGNLILEAMVKFFKWALKKAGYPSDKLMGIINTAKAVIKKIVTDPIGFIGNIVKAVKQGIDLFVTNIKKHLIAGLVSWLTGAMADVPITLPTTWDVKGILYLVLQILGLTWDNIRKKLVKRLGEKVVRIAETTVDVLKRLVTEGPMALWEMIKDKAAEIQKQVMEGIRNWVITEVVKQAVIKLVSFLNPAGAIVQAILAIYNTVMFFVENWSRIVEFVKTVFNSIADIAMGRLSAAAQAVENALAMTIPIILNFLARLIGLSGIGKAVSGIIQKIRKPIDKVVDKIIASVAKMAEKLFKKAKAGAGALKDKIIRWWTVKTVFKTKDGGTHKLFFRGTGAKAKLLMASAAPKGVVEMIESRRKAASRKEKPLTAGQRDALTTAKKKQQDLDGFIRANTTTTKTTKSAATLDIRPEIQARLEEIQKLLVAGDVIPSDAQIPLTNVTYQTSAGRAHIVRAEPLTKLPGNTTGQNTRSGSPPYPLGWAFAQESNKPDPALGLTSAGTARRSVEWVRVHLLSHRLHGPAAGWNLTPAQQGVNKDLEILETKTANRLKKGDVLSYETKVTYKGNKPIVGASSTGDEGHYAAKIEVTIKKKENGDYKDEGTKPIGGTYGVPSVVDPEVLFDGLKSSVRKSVERAHDAEKIPTWTSIDRNLHLTDPNRPKPWLTEVRKAEIKRLIDELNEKKAPKS